MKAIHPILVLLVTVLSSCDDWRALYYERMHILYYQEEIIGTGAIWKCLDSPENSKDASTLLARAYETKIVKEFPWSTKNNSNNISILVMSGKNLLNDASDDNVDFFMEKIGLRYKIKNNDIWSKFAMCVSKNHSINKLFWEYCANEARLAFEGILNPSKIFAEEIITIPRTHDEANLPYEDPTVINYTFCPADALNKAIR